MLRFASTQAAVLVGTLPLLAGCHGNPGVPASAISYEIVAGARYNGGRQVIAEPHRLAVVDRRGEPPDARFYALWAKDAGTGQLLHSVIDVVTTEGDLFGLAWCPD